MCPSGMYAMCALPKNGSMWCSHIEYSSMSRTITMLLCDSANSASPMTVARILPIPLRHEQHRLGHAARRLEQPFALGIFAEQLELAPDERFVLRERRRSLRSSLLSGIFHVVVVGLPQHEARELGRDEWRASTRQKATMMFSDVGMIPCMNGTSRFRLW